jgi:hypothetical protein
VNDKKQSGWLGGTIQGHALKPASYIHIKYFYLNLSKLPELLNCHSFRLMQLRRENGLRKRLIARQM